MPKKKGKEEQTLDEKLKMAIVPKEEEPYKVPDNWVWTRLGNIANFSSGNGFPEKYQGFLDKEIPFYKVGSLKDAMSNGEIYESTNYIDEEILKTIKGKIFHKNSIIFAKIGEAIRLNRRAILTENSCIDNNLMALIPKDCLYYRFAYYWTKKEDFYQYAKATTVPSIRQNVFENLDFALPPIDEQKRIVNKLDYFFDKIQKVKEIIEEVKEKNEARKESILSKAFTGELTAKWRADNIHSAKELLSKISDEKLSNWEQECQKAEAEGRKKPTKPKLKSIDEMIVPNDEIPYEIPNNWVWTRLEDISYNFQVGLVKSALEQSEDKEYKYLKMNNITNDGKLTLDQLVCVDATLEEYEKFKLKKGDFLFNTRNSYELVGKNTVFDLEEDYLYNNNILKINFYEGVNSKVISYYLNSPMGRDRLTEIKSGTTNVSAIYAKDLKKVTIPLPPIEEQKEIVRILDNIFTKENLINELISLEDKIQALEKSILSKAFRGELGTNSKDDIEAMELLKEILQK